MSDIRLGVIAGEFKPVTHLKNISPIWKGPLLLDTKIMAPNCWLKAVTLPELVLECFGHLLAKESGLPFLIPIVVTDPMNVLKSPSKFFFATEDAKSPSLRQLTINYPAFESIYYSALKAWAEAPTLAVLDELLANGDRNTGNLLFDGKNKWIPIDFSRAKGVPAAPAPSWDGTEIRLDIKPPNHLIEFFQVLDDANVRSALKRVDNARLFYSVMQHFAGLPVPGCESIAQRLTVWTQDRRAWSLRRLLGERLVAIFGTSKAIA